MTPQQKTRFETVLNRIVMWHISPPGMDALTQFAGIKRAIRAYGRACAKAAQQKPVAARRQRVRG